MIINKTKTSALSEKILTTVLKRKELKNIDFLIEVLRYESENEFGYCIEANDQKICFSRSGTNGDFINIYNGHKANFNDNYEFAKFNKYHFNVPNKKVNKTSFRFDDVLACAKKIVELIISSESTYKLEKVFEDAKF